MDKFGKHLFAYNFRTEFCFVFTYEQFLIANYIRPRLAVRNRFEV